MNKASFTSDCKFEQIKPFFQLISVINEVQTAKCMFTGDIYSWLYKKHYLNNNDCTLMVTRETFTSEFWNKYILVMQIFSPKKINMQIAQPVAITTHW